jgi:hypothetical protein
LKSLIEPLKTLIIEINDGSLPSTPEKAVGLGFVQLSKMQTTGCPEINLNSHDKYK